MSKVTEEDHYGSGNEEKYQSIGTVEPMEIIGMSFTDRIKGLTESPLPGNKEVNFGGCQMRDKLLES